MINWPSRARIGKLIFLLPLAAALSTGLLAAEPDGKIPIGLFDVDDPKALAELRKLGFDTIQTYQRAPERLAALAEAARNAGIRMLVHPDRLMASTASARGFPTAAWYLCDEPDVNGVSPQALRALDAKVKAWDPVHPTAFVVGHSSAAAAYADGGDIIMIDWYPVPHLPLRSLGDHVARTVSAANGKPVWAVLQAFDWRDFPQRDPKKPRVGRFPSHAELRFMTYDALTQGARGLFFFRFGRPGGETLFGYPEELQALARVVRELASLQDVFSSGSNGELPAELRATGLSGRRWTFSGRDYVVLLNRESGACAPLPPAALSPVWRRLFDQQPDIKSGSGSGPCLAPSDAIVLEGR